MTDPVEVMARAHCVADGKDPDGDFRIGETATLSVAVERGKEQLWRVKVRRMRAMIAALDAAGWAIVPKEATAEITAHANAMDDPGSSIYGEPFVAAPHGEAYRAMVEAGRVKP